MSAVRADTKRLIARQLCIANEQIWDKLSIKQAVTYLTLAETIIATVERKAKICVWPSGTQIDFEKDY